MVSGVPGKPVTFSDGELSVDRVRVGTVLTQNDEVRDRSAGMFVAVGVTGSGDRSSGAQPRVCRACQQGRALQDLRPDLGLRGARFQDSTDIVSFEVARIEG